MNSKKNSYEYRVRLVLRFMAVALLTLFFVCLMACLFAPNKEYRRFPLLLVVLLFALCVVGGLLLYFFLYKFRRKLEEYEENFIVSELPTYRIPENMCWSESNTHILQHYDALIDRKKLLEMSIESSHYIALQQQINPHFLYNALDSIRGDLLAAGNRRTADTVKALSKYFSYSVSNLNQLATIREELGNVMDYFSVQKYRFESRLSITIHNEIGEWELNEFYIPRLSVQPLVENSIVHGLDESNHSGVINVYVAYCGEDIMIKVADDGKGIDPETLERMNKAFLDNQSFKEFSIRKEKKGGIALDNVNTRVKLLFGNHYGLKIYSMKAVGTHVELLIPKIREDYNYEGL